MVVRDEYGYRMKGAGVHNLLPGIKSVRSTRVPVFATVTIVAHRRPVAASRFKYVQGFSSLTQAVILLLGSHSFSSLRFAST